MYVIDAPYNRRSMLSCCPCGRELNRDQLTDCVSPEIGRRSYNCYGIGGRSLCLCVYSTWVTGFVCSWHVNNRGCHISRIRNQGSSLDRFVVRCQLIGRDYVYLQDDDRWCMVYMYVYFSSPRTRLSYVTIVICWLYTQYKTTHIGSLLFVGVWLIHLWGLAVDSSILLWEFFAYFG